MDSRPETLPPDELLAQLGWVRAMARSLVADPDVTDDVLQQVCLLALQKAPREGGPRLRAWLATVTRRLAQHAARASGRRRHREQAAARPEALASTADVAIHREALRSLVQAVTALDEPAYAVIVARYFDGRSVAEIAARDGASAEAVRQRLSRARQQLRARLQTLVDKDREGWLRAALPLAPAAASIEGLGAAPAVSHLGGLIVAKGLGAGVAKLVVGLVLLVGLLVGTSYVVSDGRQGTLAAPAGARLPGATADDVGAALQPLEVPLPEQLVSAAAADGPAAGGSAPSAPVWPAGITTYVVTGRVVDTLGAPWPGAVVRCALDEATGGALKDSTDTYSIALADLPSTTTDAQGRFSMLNPWAAGLQADRAFAMQPAPVVVVQAEGMALHAFPLLDHDGRDRDLGELVLSMRGGAIVARLIDPSGAPVTNAGGGIFSWGRADGTEGTPGFPESKIFNLMGFTRVTAGPDGRLEIRDLWPCKCQLSLSSAQHVEQYVKDIHVGPGQTVDLGDVVMALGGRVAGVVRDAEGEPVAGAEVWVWKPSSVFADGVGQPEAVDWESAEPLPSVLEFMHQLRVAHNSRTPVKTDAGGRFDRSGLSGEVLDVFVEAPGWEPLRVTGVTLDAAPLELSLAPETNLRVVVRDEGSGAVVTTAALKAFRCSRPFASADHDIAVARAVTPGDESGAFVVHAIGRQGTRLVVSAPGRATQTLLVAASEPEPVIVRLARECVALGRVVDEQGAPVSGAVARLRPVVAPSIEKPDGAPAKRDDHAGEVIAGSDGSFRFDGLAGGAFMLTVRAPGFVTSDAAAVDLAPAGTQSLPVVILRRAAGISGRVRFADGTPARGLFVLLHNPGRTEEWSARAVTTVDTSAGFAFPELEPGIHPLAVCREMGRLPILELEVPLTESEQRVVDVVLPRLPVLRGRVTAGGVPVAEARLRGRLTTEDEDYRSTEVLQVCGSDGGFVLQLDHEGTFQFHAERTSGGRSATRLVQAAWGLDQSLDFELGTASVAGRVIDAGDGTSPADAEVRLMQHDEPVAGWLAATSTGSFDIPALLAGAYQLQARSSAYPVASQEVQLADGQRLQDLRFLVTRGAVIDGLVVDGHGQPDGAWVYLVTPGDRPTLERYGAPRGSFRIEGIAPGHYRLVVAGAGYEDDLTKPQRAEQARALEKAILELDLQAGEQRHVTLQTSD